MLARYEIADYFDLNLEQIFYKGKNDSNDVWTNDLSELNGEATISLTLAEGIDGNDVVIIHEKHDGAYETLTGTYDAATRTVTFNTSSFSNYAIAYRTTTIKAPDSGVFTVDEQPNAVAGFSLLSVFFSVAAVDYIRRRSFRG